MARLTVGHFHYFLVSSSCFSFEKRVPIILDVGFRPSVEPQVISLLPFNGDYNRVDGKENGNYYNTKVYIGVV